MVSCADDRDRRDIAGLCHPGGILAGDAANPEAGGAKIPGSYFSDRQPLCFCSRRTLGGAGERRKKGKPAHHVLGNLSGLPGEHILASPGR